MENIYKKYEEARDKYYIKKIWIKGNEKLLFEEYDHNLFKRPCDGWVKNKDDAKDAVLYFIAFYQKLEYENKLTNKMKNAFNRTIDKYKNYE
jgi:hypothetical protein